MTLQSSSSYSTVINPQKRLTVHLAAATTGSTTAATFDGLDIVNL